MAGKSTQGFEVIMAKESSIGVSGGSLFNIRVAENPTFTSVISQAADVMVKGFSHWGDADAPIIFEGLQESAITLPVHIRRSATANETPVVAVIAESLGCKVTADGDNSADTGSTASKSNHADTETANDGFAFMPYDSVGGKFWPSLVADDDGTGWTWLFQLPNAQASGNSIPQMYCITPDSAALDDTDGLFITLRTRMQLGSSAGDNWELRAAGCACSSLGTMEIVPNQVPVLSPTFHVADLSYAQVALSNEEFRDTANTMVVGGDFYAGIADAGTAIARDANEINLIKATVEFGMSTVAIPGTGGVNNVQCYMSQYDPAACSITVELLAPANYTGSKMSEWEGDNSEKSIQFVQGVSSSTDTAPDASCWGFFAPRCHLVEPPILDPFGEAYHKVTLKYRPVPSEFTSTAFDERNAPWYLAIYTPEA